MLAYRSGVSAVAVEASMDYARKEGKLELTKYCDEGSQLKEFQKASTRPSPEGPFWKVGSGGGRPALVVPPSRVLKKTASIVLASLRGSTY
jgi:hypothetical protein